MTAYRQQALACAASLASGPRRTREIRSVVPNASSILLGNVYGWFARIERGVYALIITPQGASALARWPQPIVPAQHQPPEPKPLRNVRRTERVLGAPRADGFRSAFETDRRAELHSTESKCHFRTFALRDATERRARQLTKPPRRKPGGIATKGGNRAGGMG